MAVASFQVLCEGVCSLFGAAVPELQPDANAMTGFTLQVRGVDISVVEAPHGTAPAVFVLVEFGAPPAGRELQTWHALLDANFLMLEANAPSFSRNPVTGDVVLQYASTLHDATCEALCESICAIAEVAARWRQDYFLGDASPPGMAASASPAPARHEASVFV